MSQTNYNKMSIDFGYGMSKTFKPVRQGWAPGFNVVSTALGFRYQLNNKFGLKANIGFDQVKNKKNVGAFFGKSMTNPNVFTTNIISQEFMAVLNWGNMADRQTWTDKFGLLGYGGPGVTFITGQNAAKKNTFDVAVNFRGGLTLMYKATDKVSITGDASLTFYALQNSYIDQQEFITNRAASGVDGYTGALQLGISYYLGESETHMDWAPNAGTDTKDLDALKAKIEKAEKDMMDDDKDGVPNYLDQEPGTSAGANVDTKGKTVKVEKVVDMDGDGVLDVNDFCPTIKGSSSANGCPDGDGDGVYDFVDKCPKAAGLAIDGGCPVIKDAVKTLMTKAMAGVQFDNGKATLIKKSLPILDEVAKVMMANPSYNLSIDGHTDNVGDPAKNLQLSEDRAKAVKAYLMGKGVAEGRMKATGYGDTKPKASNATTKGKAANRRVEFIISFEQ